MTTARVFLVLALIVCGCFISLEAQNFSLKLQGQSNQEQRILDSLYEPSTYDDLVSIEATVESLKNQLYYLGYVQLKLLSLDKKQDKFTARFDLGPSYSTIAIFGKTELFEALGYALEQDTDTKQRFVVVEMPDLEQTLNKISQNLSRQSYPFARVQLQNIREKNRTQLRADLNVNTGDKRQLQAIKILGYDNVSKSFIKHFLDLKPQTPLDLERIREQMTLVNQLPFVAQKRQAEVLFTQDSTMVYLYLEKIKSNRFDGFLGFGSNETTGNIEFDGYLDLNLINNLNYGESFKLYYKSDEIDQKTLDISLVMPYLFGTPLGAELNLNLFKKDSTFTTAQQAAKLTYPINDKQQVALGVRFTASNILSDNEVSNLEDFDSQFYELGYRYTKRQTNDLLFPIKSRLDFSISYGERQGVETTQQRHLKIAGSSIFNLNSKNSIFLKFHLEDLKSETYLLNELLRFGGIRSIRGFQENSLFAQRFGVLCSEYRYRLGSGLFVHSVMDVGFFQNAQNQDQQIFGFGLGFGLRTSGGVLRLTYANGKTKQRPFDLSNSKVHLSFTSTF